ncbi:MAG: hypothetical protein OIF32_06330 [Campylobacterales bacterium]|nr:hypothetical protein [Campylobacterales bacterium]
MDTIKLIKKVKFSKETEGRLVGYQSNKICRAEILTKEKSLRAFGFTVDEAINKVVKSFEKAA